VRPDVPEPWIKRCAWGVGLLLLVESCGGQKWKPVDVGAVERSKPKTLLLVVTPERTLMGRFRYNPFTGVMGAAIAAGLEGQSIGERHHLVDPSMQVGAPLATAFSERYGLGHWTIVEEKRDQVSQKGHAAPPPPPPSRPGTDLALELRTAAWGVEEREDRGYVVYEVSAKLIDNRSGKVVAAGDCLGTEPPAVTSPTFDALTNDSSRLKREFALAVERCVRRFGALLAVEATPEAETPPLPPARSMSVNGGGRANTRPSPDGGATDATLAPIAVPQRTDPE
jgi:hypothetical protein